MKNTNTEKCITEDAKVTMNESGVAIVELEYPFDFEGESVKKVTLRRPKYKEVKHSRKLKEYQILDYFLTTLSERPQELIDECDPTDVYKMDKLVMYFLGLAET